MYQTLLASLKILECCGAHWLARSTEGLCKIDVSIANATSGNHSDEPYLVPEVLQLFRVLGVDRELVLRFDENSVLEPPAAKHDRAFDVWVRVDDLLEGQGIGL